jgi:hypothetical protein
VTSAGTADSTQDKIIPLDRILPELFALNPLARNWRFVGIAAFVGVVLF